MSAVSCVSSRGLTSISLCSPMVSTWRSLLLSGMAAWEHVLKEAKLCSRKLTEQ